MWEQLDNDTKLFSDIWTSNVPHIAIENPVMHRYAMMRIEKFHSASQTFQPWQFGHGVVKRTCLWIKALPKLIPTNIVDGRYPECILEPDVRDRQMRRSITYPGIAAAMADQWGEFLRKTYSA